ncbi:RNA-directed DNA polymerase, eukaryota [Tanacetum coccineum]
MYLNLWRWKWDLESSGDFSVASVRKIIDDKSLSDVDSKTRWIKYVPIKMNVHAWKVKTDSLPTRFNVSHRGIDIDSIMCVICDNGVDKLFARSLIGIDVIRRLVGIAERQQEIERREAVARSLEDAIKSQNVCMYVLIRRAMAVLRPSVRFCERRGRVHDDIEEHGWILTIIDDVHLLLSLLKTSQGHPMELRLVSELEVEVEVLKAYDGEERGVWRWWVIIGT